MLLVLNMVQLYEMIIVIEGQNLLNKNGVQQMLVVQHGLQVNGHLYGLEIRMIYLDLIFV